MLYVFVNEFIILEKESLAIMKSQLPDPVKCIH